MKTSILSILALYLGITIQGILTDAAAAATFRHEDKVYITGLTAKTTVAIPIERISFRKPVTNKCGILEIKTTIIPALFVIDRVEFRPATFPLKNRKSCTKDSPNDTSKYKTSDTTYLIGGLAKEKSYTVQIVKATTKKLKTTKCGYASFKLVETLTPFSSSYEINIYTVNKIKVKNMPIADKPKC